MTALPLAVALQLRPHWLLNFVERACRQVAEPPWVLPLLPGAAPLRAQGPAGTALREHLLLAPTLRTVMAV